MKVSERIIQAKPSWLKSSSRYSVQNGQKIITKAEINIEF